MSLRSSLIKLAYRQPALRAKLLPILVGSTLRSGRATDFSRTKVEVAGEKMRVRVSRHGSSDVIYIEELPQKPLKKRLVGLTRCDVIPVWQWRWFTEGDRFLPVNLLRAAKIVEGDSYDQAVDKLRNAVRDAVNDVENAWREQPSERPAKDPVSYQPTISEEQVNYLTVEPASYKPIEVTGKDFSFTAHWNEFAVYSPDSDFQAHDPYFSGMKASSPAAARKLFKILSAKPDALKGLKYDELENWFGNKKINVRYVHSVWH